VNDSISKDDFDKIIKKIIEHISPLKIICFGSYARGDFHTGSDLDLCIIVRKASDWFDRHIEFKKLFKTETMETEIEPHIYTLEEYSKMLKDENSFILQIAKEGRIVYEQ
jgi:predicted nucleotidyltransferase